MSGNNGWYAEREKCFSAWPSLRGGSLEPSVGHAELITNHIMCLLFPHLPRSSGSPESQNAACKDHMQYDIYDEKRGTGTSALPWGPEAVEWQWVRGEGTRALCRCIQLALFSFFFIFGKDYLSQPLPYTKSPMFGAWGNCPSSIFRDYLPSKG